MASIVARGASAPPTCEQPTREHPTHRPPTPGRPSATRPTGTPATPRRAGTERRRPFAAPSPASRDPRLWDRLVQRYGDRLATVARRSLSRCGLPTYAEDVEDLVQEVWCRLVERWGPRPGRGIRGGESGLFAYLARSVRNAAVDRARTVGAVKRGHRCPRDRGRVELLADGMATPEERLLRRDDRRLFRARCRPYTSRTRRRRDLRVVELALLDGWTSRQIAAALRPSLAPSSIDSLIHRVRRGLAGEGVPLPPRR